ncbi:MAG: DUF3408 domain-containing protein [Muribaculaceae bacterium]|nr:DUF3408 domain-containing protein [Muribaculaceae bacterium]
MINIFLIIAVIIVNVALFTYLFVNGKRDKCKSNIIEVLTASGTMISALDTFRKNIPQMSEEFVSDVKPAIDSYIRERVEAYIQANAVVMPTVTDIQEPTPIQSRADDAITGASTYNEDRDRDNPMPQELSSEEMESAFESVPIADLYKDAFLHETENPFRTTSGKQVCIRKGYHRVITMLLESAECPCSTITGFIDNVLSDHFNMNRDSIEAIITSRYVNQKSL